MNNAYSSFFGLWQLLIPLFPNVADCVYLDFVLSQPRNTIFGKGVPSVWTAALLCYGLQPHLYRQPDLLCTPQNFVPSSKFLGNKYFLVLRLPMRHYWAVPKIWRSHDFRDAQKRNFEPVDETLVFQGHLNVFWGSFMASLCSSRWSDQK
jgi:hypothetical protein